VRVVCATAHAAAVHLRSAARAGAAGEAGRVAKLPPGAYLATSMRAMRLLSGHARCLLLQRAKQQVHQGAAYYAGTALLRRNSSTIDQRGRKKSRHAARELGDNDLGRDAVQRQIDAPQVNSKQYHKRMRVQCSCP
jgi:hypothetical protein